MRIGIDARTIFSPRPHGTGRNLCDAYRLIPKLRPEWTFHLYHQRRPADCPLVCGDGESDGHSRIAWPANVISRRIDIPGDRLDLWFQVRLPLAARRERIDLLHLPANAAPAWRPVPTVVTIHDLAPLTIAREVPRRAQATFRRGLMRAVRGAQHIITPSAATRDELCADHGVAGDRITVIPWAPDQFICQTIRPRSVNEGPPAVRARSASEGNAPTTRPLGNQAIRTPASDPICQRYQLTRPWLLNFSGDSRRKNAAGLLAAFAQLPADVRGACDLVLVGCSALEFRASLTEHAQRLGIIDHCRLLGFVPHVDLAHLLRNAQALLMPSLAEGFGLPILDAFACGVPVLTSNCSSMPEVAGDAALYCDPSSAASIAAAIQRVIQPALARELIARGRRRVRQFTWERTAAAMCGVYERCLVEAGRPEKSSTQRALTGAGPRLALGHATRAHGNGAPVGNAMGDAAAAARETACR